MKPLPYMPAHRARELADAVRSGEYADSDRWTIRTTGDREDLHHPLSEGGRDGFISLAGPTATGTYVLGLIGLTEDGYSEYDISLTDTITIVGDSRRDWALAGARQQVDTLTGWVADAAREGRYHEIPRHLEELASLTSELEASDPPKVDGDVLRYRVGGWNVRPFPGVQPSCPLPARA